MILHVLRALFILLMAAAGWFYLSGGGRYGQESHGWIAFPIAIAVGILFVAIDVLSPRRKLAIFAGSFFGLVVGIAIAYGLGFAVDLLIDQYANIHPFGPGDKAAAAQFVKTVVGIVCCYL